MIKPKLIKSQDIISLANKEREIAKETTIGPKIIGWIKEIKLDKDNKNPREEWRKLWL